MKKLLLILLCLPFIGFGQGWERSFGDTEWDKGKSVQQTIDGGYIIAGCTELIGGNGLDIYLIKTDAFGNEEWTKTFGGLYNDEGYSIQQTSDGGYIICGYTEISLGNGSYTNYVSLIKTDLSGNEQWNKTFGGTNDDITGYSVQQTSDGGYIISGGGGKLIKTDGSGNEQWSQTYGNLYTFFYSVQQTIDGGYITTGVTSTITTSWDVYIVKTDENGNEQWNTTFGDTIGTDEGHSIQQTSDGGYIITGRKSVESPIIGTNNDLYLIKTDGNGNEQWNKTFGGTDSERGYSIQQTSDGGYIIAGYTSSFGNGNNDVYLIKTDGNGNEQWNKTFGGTEDDYGYSVQQTSDGGYIITGSKEDEFGNADIDVYLIKTDTNGNITSTVNIPINTNRKLQKTVDLLGRETKGKKNQPLFFIYDDETVEKRITIDQQ